MITMAVFLSFPSASNSRNITASNSSLYIVDWKKSSALTDHCQSGSIGLLFVSLLDRHWTSLDSGFWLILILCSSDTCGLFPIDQVQSQQSLGLVLVNITGSCLSPFMNVCVAWMTAVWASEQLSRYPDVSLDPTETRVQQ